jgi:hypothetical protein
MLTGRHEQARARNRAFATIVDYDPTTDLAVIDALENPALTQKAVSLIQQDPVMLDGTFGKAMNLMLLGESGLALDNLEKAFAEGDPYAVHMNRMDLYDPLRENPRFQALLKKMNLWQ